MRLRDFLNMIDASYCDIVIRTADKHMLVTGDKSDLLEVLSLATLDRYVVSFAPDDSCITVIVSDVEDEGEMGEYKQGDDKW